MNVKCDCGTVGSAALEEDGDPLLVNDWTLLKFLERDGWRKLGGKWVCPLCNRVGSFYYEAVRSRDVE